MNISRFAQNICCQSALPAAVANGEVALQGKVESFIACCSAILACLDASRKQISHKQLNDAIMSFLEKHLATYGWDHWIFKHHQAAHLPDMYRKFGALLHSRGSSVECSVLLGCFVQERKHKVVKRFSKDRLTAKNYEIGLMQDRHAHVCTCTCL